MLGDRHDSRIGLRVDARAQAARAPASLARELARGEARALIACAGQGVAWWPELVALRGEPLTGALVEAADQVMSAVLATREARWSGLYAQGFSLRRWVAGALPEEAYLTATPISLPAIFVAQIARMQSLVRRGLGAAFEGGAIAGLTGYSQGIAAATLIAERRDGGVTIERFARYVEALAWLGFEVTRASEEIARGRAPMGLVVGPDKRVIAEAMAGVPGVHLALENDRRRHVLSGAPEAIAAVMQALERRGEREREAKRAGRHGGAVTSASLEPIATSAAFHSPVVAEGLARTLERCAGFEVAPVLPVFDPAWVEGEAERTRPGEAMLASIAVRPGRWQATMMRAARGVDAVIDLGPGDGVARLTRGALRGLGVEVHALGASDEERERFFAEPRQARAVRYRDFAPRLAELPGGEVVIDNAFSRATGAPPVILPGMTPTTVDVPIVAAAANAGFVAELAGGGQVSEAVFEARMKELGEALAPGVEVVFNALLLDAYLWGLHLGDKRLVQKARAAGAPICGVTVSAGIPALEDAVRLLDELAALGMRVNAFKPGTKAQIEEVVRIAAAAPQHTIFVHVEGGKAGGHHSWEDLEELLLESYHAIRSQPNLVLCVGGGIADEARAVELLLGTWAARHGLPEMPVDAVFIGTLAMACREASATAAVKAAMVAAPGVKARWVGRGEVAGGVTSGRSQLDADIHYLDNAAARCGRLLDEVAGDAEAVRARRDEIIEALGETAKPYFGDVEAMSYRELLARMVELMAIGRGDRRYEDGRWLDVTWRQRFFDMLRRVEARLAGSAGIAGVEVASVAPDLAALDAPEAVLAALGERYPHAACERVHAADAIYFLKEVCARPGKPVPFVPVLDQDVRRHFKSDSLWQAQHPRYAAEEVLVIPGPEAVAGLGRAEEPVAELLGRFNRALIAALAARQVMPRRVDVLRAEAPLRESEHPQGVTVGGASDHLVLRIDDAEAASALLEWVAARYRGPLAALIGRTEAEGLALVEGGRVDNPIPRLFAPLTGATLTLRCAADARLTNVLYQPDDEEWVALELDRASRITLRVGWEGRPIQLRPPQSGRPLEAAYALPIEVVAGARPRFVVRSDAAALAVRELYRRTLFATPLDPVAPFSSAEVPVARSPETTIAYQRVTGRTAAGALPSASQVFSLTWPAIYRTLACDEIGDGLLRLVHLDNRVEHLLPVAHWPAHDLAARATIVRIEDAADHRVVEVEATLVDPASRPLARLRSGFYIRGRFPAPALRSRETLTLDLELDPTQRAFVLEHPWIVAEQGDTSAVADGAAHLDVTIEETRSPTTTRHLARGTLTMGALRASIALDTDQGATHPLRALLAALGVDAGRRPVRATPRLTLATASASAPSRMDVFAEVGGDHNPIHTRVLAARLAGLPRPIAHGMWTAARMEAFVAEHVASPERVRAFDVAFSAPLFPGETLTLSAARVGLAGHGAAMIEVTAATERDGRALVVARAHAEITPARTACVFPGQGIQQRDMGMAALMRSPAARRSWERADRFTRASLGFSILRVVRENPRELDVLARGDEPGSRERLVHPQGVLHLTQLTQVAMAALAYAQVAELREAGVWRDDAILAGHSVGEYNALSAGADVLPLEAVLAIVYQRGRVMHGLVPRDAHGESGFRMGVIRPNLARLDHAGAEALVAEVATRTGGFLEIVNYNVRDRQYAVTGHTRALAALADALAARQPAGAKPAYLEVPGIDVPFHSRALVDGVADFRRALDRHLPARIDHRRLVGRYIPNLVAAPFALTRSFAERVRDAVGPASRATLDDIIARWDEHARQPGALARVLLVELLAWQFASPVRWIETQEIFCGDPADHELAVDEILEVGVGYQPTLANMARLSLSTRPVRVMNVEADRAQVFAEDRDAPPPDALDGERPPAPPTHPSAAPAPSTTSTTPAPTPSAPAPTSLTAPPDQPLSHAEALTSIVALQTRLRPEQIGPAETLDGLFDGVSSRRNQILLDLGAEFEAGSIDRAHEVPLADLARELSQRAPRWRAPGAYLQAAHADLLKRVFSRAGLSARDLSAHLETTFGFGPGLVTATLDLLALETRPGASARDASLPLGALADLAVTTRDDARQLLDRAVALLAERRKTSYPRLSTSAPTASAAVDPAALGALEARLFGPTGALTDAARALAAASGLALDPTAPLAQPDPRLAHFDHLVAELGQDFIDLLQPRFDPARHVAFTSSWSTAHRDLVRLAFDALNDRLDAPAVARELDRLAPHAASPRLTATAHWFAARARQPWLRDALRDFATRTPPAARFAGRTALVTGASKGSIAAEIVAELLRGGARVVCTTSQLDRARVAYYRDLYESAAAPHAELHVVPCNLTSFLDIDQLLEWLARAETEQLGAAVRVLKPALTPDLIVPFAALKDAGTADQLGGTAEATLRAMVLGVERLVALVARRLIADATPTRCHVLLPLSPNHGAFGGDGAYAESKAALEVLLEKHKSEHHAWGRQTTMIGARIGWVRGTGLMAHNDAIAPALEAATGIRTFSADEMGRALADLLTDDARQRAAAAPFVADLSGGFERVPDLKRAVDEVRRAVADDERHARALEALRAAERALLEPPPATSPTVAPLPAWPAPSAPPAASPAWPAPIAARPEDMVVIVGFGEIGPGGTARTRYDLETTGRLGAPAVLELAWLTGLIRWESTARGGHWLDTARDEIVPEHAIAERYHDLVRARVGVRFVEPDTTGFDPERSAVYEQVFLERDFTFEVASEDEARAFSASDPERTVIAPDPATSSWRVTRKAGSELRVPREVRLSRRVAGQLPTGFSLARYGFSGEMLERVDPVALMNLAATVESFVMAGLTPEELLAWVHPARVGTTQGSGMGGMKSLHRLYVDHLLGRERQSDILQETLINVVFAYATSAYVGSYGPMSHPVAACATAALSLEDALDKITLGKCDVVMAGGWDDLSAEGVIGFGDMNATADTDKMLALGLAPDQMSRANDLRRRGFVEAQGGGALLLARGDVALRLGLPVYGVLAYAASFGDGINRSIPAPGIGCLAAALGGSDSPLARALARFGLTADEIALVSKHDTSTQANDPNESAIHQALQDTLGRTPGNPLMVVSQKALLGHAKGGAAAWQTIGLCQLMAGGVVPANPNLDSVDPALAPHEHLVYTNRRLDPGPAVPLYAGLATSLGFGHVSALLLLVHPAAFSHALSPEARAAWQARAAARTDSAATRWREVMLGRAPLYDKRTDRRFAAPDGTPEQRREETHMLFDPAARLDATRGTFTPGGPS